MRKLTDYIIKYDVEEKVNIADEIITKEHIRLFYSIFKGRKDVYSKRTVRKDGKAAYYPVCNNFWRYGICPRCEQKKAVNKMLKYDYGILGAATAFGKTVVGLIWLLKER